MKLRKMPLVCFAVLVILQGLFAADFEVTSPGFYYRINNVEPNPTLTLERGKTYTFHIQTDSIHPFYIDSPGVTDNDTSSGTITYAVPTNQANYVYFCSYHGFGADIITVPPPSPPEIKIVSLTVSSNIVLRSTGTNTWSVIPEFSTNLVTTNWFALTVQTNHFLGGTNETICGKPPDLNIFIRIRSQPN